MTHRVLAEHLSDKLLVVSHEGIDGQEYVLITFDCGIVRAKRDDEGIVVDIHDPVADEVVASTWAHVHDLWQWTERDQDG